MDEEAALLNDAQVLGDGDVLSNPQRRRSEDAPANDHTSKKARIGAPASPRAHRLLTKHAAAGTKPAKLQRPSDKVTIGHALTQRPKSRGDIYDEAGTVERESFFETSRRATPLKIWKKARPKSHNANTENGVRAPKHPLAAPKSLAKKSRRANIGQTDHPAGPEPPTPSKKRGRPAKSTSDAERDLEGSEPNTGPSSPAEEADVVEEASDEREEDNALVAEQGANGDHSPAERDAGPPSQRREIAQDANPADEERKRDETMLLGKLSLWEGIEGAVTKIRTSGIDQSTYTNEAMQINVALKSAASLYKQIVGRRAENKSTGEFESKISLSLRKVEKLFTSLCKAKDIERVKDLVRDVYVRTMPKCVILLKSAMLCRFQGFPEEPYDIRGLEEIIRIQKMSQDLLEKIIGWNVKPDTPFPIVQPAKQRIYPKLRDLRKVFVAHQKDMAVTARLKENQRQTEQRSHATPEPEAPDDEEEEEDYETPAHVRQQRRDDQNVFLGRMLKDIQREKARAFRQSTSGFSRLPTASRRERYPPKQAERHQDWTIQEDEALCDQLLNNLESRSLPAEERYLRILNTPLLQNKLPEHIRERALLHKNALIEATLEYRGRIPRFLVSIQ